MNEVKIKQARVLNGGVIEMFEIEGFYFVRSIVDSVLKHSEAISKWKADYLMHDAHYHGNLDF